MNQLSDKQQIISSLKTEKLGKNLIKQPKFPLRHQKCKIPFVLVGWGVEKFGRGNLLQPSGQGGRSGGSGAGKRRANKYMYRGGERNFLRNEILVLQQLAFCHQLKTNKQTNKQPRKSTSNLVFELTTLQCRNVFSISP